MILSRLFKKHKKIDQESNDFDLKCDIHSHLIPGIDDGVKSLEEALGIIRALHKIGYKKIITTPHVMLDFYNNSTDNILNGLKTLKDAVKAENIEIDIQVAAEYYLDEGFLIRLKNNDILTFGENYLLFETSYISKPLDFENIIFEIQTAGLTPVMAHPERYRYINKDLYEYLNLKNLGILFQCNINSFSGYYGKLALENINLLNQNSLIDFLGSDIHHNKHLQVLENLVITKDFHKINSKNSILNNTL